MIILEDDLEKMMVAKELTELTLEGYQDLSDRLHQLQPHMQASTGCWEDTINQVERMLRRANACPGETGPTRLCFLIYFLCFIPFRVSSSCCESPTAPCPPVTPTLLA